MVRFALSIVLRDSSCSRDCDSFRSRKSFAWNAYGEHTVLEGGCNLISVYISRQCELAAELAYAAFADEPFAFVFLSILIVLFFFVFFVMRRDGEYVVIKLNVHIFFSHSRKIHLHSVCILVFLYIYLRHVESMVEVVVRHCVSKRIVEK